MTPSFAPVAAVPDAAVRLSAAYVCPACRNDLLWDADTASCDGCGRTFGSFDSIPVLVAADGSTSQKLDQASYFLSKIELRRGTAPTMAPWRKRLFIATSYLAADAAEYFNLPPDRTVIMGSHIDV